MAPSNEDSEHQKQQDDVRNPFIAFRQFADQRMADLLGRISDLTTAFGFSASSSDRASQDYQAWLQDIRTSRQSVDREAEEATRIMDVYTKAHEDSAYETVENSALEDSEHLRCLYRPVNLETPQRESNDPELCLEALKARLYHPVPGAPIPAQQYLSAPISYLLCSPYSPIQLEHHKVLGSQGIPWREAFEDLLVSRRAEDFSSEHELSPLDRICYMLRLFRLGMHKREEDRSNTVMEASQRYPSQLAGSPSEQPSEWKNKKREMSHNPEGDPGDGSEEQEVTELDLYSYLLGTQGHPPANKSLASSSTAMQPYPHCSPTRKDSSPMIIDNRPRPSILSTLTTTERTVLQDGTVHTKVVLKKRFADGREESTETAHTQNPLPKPQYQSPTALNDQAQGQVPWKGGGKEKERGKGWFWT